MSGEPFWSQPVADVLAKLQCAVTGLTSAEAAQRFRAYGPNALGKKGKIAGWALFLRQFRSPITLILLFATFLSLGLGDHVDAGIILGIVLLSGGLSYWQERGANNAVQKLLALVQVTAKVLRDGKETDVSVEEVVPGDVVLLAAGDIVPGDCLLLEANELHLDEATLTGETFPVEKQPGAVAADAPLSARTNALFMGTHVISGTAKALVVHTGKETELGQISERLRLRPAETDFEHGVRRFGYFLMEVTMVLVLVIFAVNVSLHRPVLDSLLFSLALAVGLTPQLLPAIISINLARGAREMAKVKVIVKRLAAIENLGSMNVLCSDKTGTLTEGKVTLHEAVDTAGKPSEHVFLLAHLNASFEAGFANPMDAAIKAYKTLDITKYVKLDEIPYDFVRKRLSVLVQRGAAGERLLVTKGAVTSVLAVCTQAESPDDTAAKLVDLALLRADIEKEYATLSGAGYRVLGVAYREMPVVDHISRDDEKDMVFAGFLVFEDPAKAGINEVLADLRKLGVTVKIITGDNVLVAATVGRQVGLRAERLLSGTDLRALSDEALMAQVGEVDLFAEIEPNQKERIIAALRKAGNVVGYMGDGINDASAIHAADVGISVNTAADVAKEAADFVLLDKDLAVLHEGVKEGRRTFANTLKYVFMATSANFGNMFSMAGASLFLSFLPLLPMQILLTNLLTDFPEMTIASDNVDPEMVASPRRWNIRFIRRFMLVFGLLSSVFDYATFGVLLLLLHAKAPEFRTGWFVESVASAALVVLVIRTRRTLFRSVPSWKLLLATLLVVLVVVVLPWTPLRDPLGFGKVPGTFFAALAGVVLAYLVMAEGVKWLFYRLDDRHRPGRVGRGRRSV